MDAMEAAALNGSLEGFGTGDLGYMGSGFRDLGFRSVYSSDKTMSGDPQRPCRERVGIAKLPAIPFNIPVCCCTTYMIMLMPTGWWLEGCQAGPSL